MVSGWRGPGPEFDEFVAASSVALLRLAVLLTFDRGAAEDVVQTCLARVANRWSTARTHPDAYARRVLVNLTRDRWRDRGRRPVEVLGAEPPPGTATESAEHQVAQRDELARLLARLPAGQRQVLVLRYFEDLSVAEVAAILRCSEGNVKSQASRALANLRRLMTDEETTCSPMTN